MENILAFLLTRTPLFYLVQPFWRDEAYSALFVQQSIPDIIAKSSFEPPVYYILLHFWIKLFGQSEIAVRSLSMAGYALSVAVVGYWAERQFRKHWLSWFTPLFYALNPMILYYAFEARAYGWYMLFIALSFYAYTGKNWRLFILSCVFGFYTHLYMVFVPFTAAVHYVATNWTELRRKTPGQILWDPMLRALVITGVGIAPWFVRILSVAPQMKSSWYYPVDLQLVKSVIGNMFVGYEGTPWFMWRQTRYLSLIILGLSLVSIVPRRTRKDNLFYFLMAVVPLAVIIAISMTIKPLYVNRYLMPVAVAEVLLIPLAFAAIRHGLTQKILAGVGLAAVVAFSCWYPAQHPKQDLRSTMREINSIIGPRDVIYADNAIIYPEVLYYAVNRSQVYLYDPMGGQFPWYIGDAIFSRSRLRMEYPVYPTRAFLVKTDGTYSQISLTTAPIISSASAKQ